MADTLKRTSIIDRAAPRREVNVPRRLGLAQRLDEIPYAMPWRCWFLLVWYGSVGMLAGGKN